MDKEQRSCRAPRLSGAVAVDGDWAHPAWAPAPPLRVDQHMGPPPEHRPDVLARAAWDDEAVHVIFRVEDRYIRAVAQRYQDPVCRDSCVEFFFTPGLHLGRSYFNVEINCGGTLLFWWHPEGGAAVPVSEEDARRLQIGHTLPKIVDPEMPGPATWGVACRLPFEVVRTYCPAAVRPAPGAVWKANFYKCADATSHPHWLTWSHVDHPVPRFHMPECFGIVEFK